MKKLEIKELNKVISYTILNPGGNITALVSNNNYSSKERRVINNIIMSKYKKVEQVGFISNEEKRLEMAGGEFCVNATRCAIYEYLKGREGKIILSVSGYKSKINGGIANNKEVYANLTINKKTGDLVDINKKMNFTFIKLDGILFGIIDEVKSKKYINDLRLNEDKTKIEFKNIMKSFNTKEKAVGIILIERNNNKIKIHPIVWVKEVDSLYYETACGSGSLATTIYYNKIENIKKLDIIQPSNYIIKVNLEIENQYIKNALVSGTMIEENNY